MSDKSYKPIACADYDIYEIAIMQNKRLRLEFESEQGYIQVEELKPLKLQIKDKAEYLLTDSKNAKEIRLDAIRHAQIIEE